MEAKAKSMRELLVHRLSFRAPQSSMVATSSIWLWSACKMARSDWDMQQA